VLLASKKSFLLFFNQMWRTYSLLQAACLAEHWWRVTKNN